MLLTSFARVLHLERTERGIALEELSIESGLVIEVLVAMESGRHEPTLEEMVRLATALECEAADLIEHTMLRLTQE